jgi:trehalose 6-phosphate phosphatase
MDELGDDRTHDWLDIVAQHKDIRNGLARLPADADHLALFIDIDGTLLGIAPTPDAVLVPPSLIEVLERLVLGLDGAVALLTGRRIADADRLFAPLKMIAAGVHGTELRSERSGSIIMLAPPVSPQFVEAVNRIGALSPGVLVEQKGAGMAVHYRNAPEATQEVITELNRIVADDTYDITLRRGRKVVEALPRGFSKATALTWLAERPPFKGRMPVMIGDDVGDESALQLAEKLGGAGLRVAGEHFSRSEADFDGVDSVRAWLADLARGLERATRTAHLPRP